MAGEAFTVRMRTKSGRVSLWLAPAGGMGLSSPCCAAGHPSYDEAFGCGVEELHRRLSPELRPFPVAS